MELDCCKIAVTLITPQLPPHSSLPVNQLLTPRIKKIRCGHRRRPSTRGSRGQGWVIGHLFSSVRTNLEARTSLPPITSQFYRLLSLCAETFGHCCKNLSSEKGKFICSFVSRCLTVAEHTRCLHSNAKQCYGVAMADFCERHPGVKPIVVRYCPACRGEHGGAKAARRMTKAARKSRAKKAARARWGKKSKKRD